MNQDLSAVKRRRVFYIPGFDPHPPRRYRELYRREGAAQAEIAGYALSVDSSGGAQWDVTAELDGVKTETRFDVLVWSDLVRATMDCSIAATYRQLARVVWAYIASGALFRLMRLRKGPMVAAFYPVLGLLLQAVFAALLGWVVGRFFGPALGWPIGLVVATAVLVLARRWDGKVFVHYLMHDFAFVVRAGGAYPAELEARLAQFVQQISEAMASEVDEVLVVGHSSGAALAVSAVCDALLGREGQISLLTLGQAIPMQSFLPGAHRLRRDLHSLAQEPRVTWVDISAPADGCSFALTDPVAVSGVDPANKRWPLILSAAYSQTLSAARLRALRHRYFRLHFQYLCAFDDPSRYDYFRITAGPQTLADVFRGRSPSGLRLETPLSPHVSMTA